MMSLSPYLPPTSGDAGAVMSLLQVISNPAEAKKALDKMVEERKAIDSATERQREQFVQGEAAARKAKTETEKLKAEADALAAKAASDLGAAKVAMAAAHRAKEQAEHSERTAADLRALTDQREQVLLAGEKELQSKLHLVAEDKFKLDRQAEQLQKREADLDIREKTLAEDIAENNKWLASLRPPRRR